MIVTYSAPTLGSEPIRYGRLLKPGRGSLLKLNQK